MSVLLVYGEGGHAAQMNRLIKRLELKRNEMVSIVDSVKLQYLGQQFVVPATRKKHKNNVVYTCLSFFNNLTLTLRVFYKYDIKLVISTGPGICVIPSLFARVLGRDVIFLETWSRFETRSFSGRIMYRLASHFYVQNKELLKLYPNAEYSGRL